MELRIEMGLREYLASLLTVAFALEDYSLSLYLSCILAWTKKRGLPSLLSCMCCIGHMFVIILVFRTKGVVIGSFSSFVVSVIFIAILALFDFTGNESELGHSIVTSAVLSLHCAAFTNHAVKGDRIAQRERICRYAMQVYRFWEIASMGIEYYSFITSKV